MSASFGTIFDSPTREPSKSSTVGGLISISCLAYASLIYLHRNFSLDRTTQIHDAGFIRQTARQCV